MGPFMPPSGHLYDESALCRTIIGDGQFFHKQSLIRHGHRAHSQQARAGLPAMRRVRVFIHCLWRTGHKAGRVVFIDALEGFCSPASDPVQVRARNVRNIRDIRNIRNVRNIRDIRNFRNVSNVRSQQHVWDL